LETLDGAPDRAVGRAPTQDEQVAAVGPEDVEGRDVVGDPGDLRLAEELHPVVVVRVVAHVAGDVGLLETADPVLQAGRARNRPLAGKRDRIAVVRMERFLLRPVLNGDVRQVRDRRDLPRLRARREERIRQVDDRRDVLQGEAPRLDREVEALPGGGRRDDRQGRVAVAPEHDLEQVGLLGLRRHPRRGACALDVDDYKRQLDHDREPERLRLEGDPGAG
jgi:hypothetical protein